MEYLPIVNYSGPSDQDVYAEAAARIAAITIENDTGLTLEELRVALHVLKTLRG